RHQDDEQSGQSVLTQVALEEVRELLDDATEQLKHDLVALKILRVASEQRAGQCPYDPGYHHQGIKGFGHGVEEVLELAVLGNPVKPESELRQSLADAHEDVGQLIGAAAGHAHEAVNERNNARPDGLNKDIGKREHILEEGLALGTGEQFQEAVSDLASGGCDILETGLKDRTESIAEPLEVSNDPLEERFLSDRVQVMEERQELLELKCDLLGRWRQRLERVIEPLQVPR